MYEPLFSVKKTSAEIQSNYTEESESVNDVKDDNITELEKQVEKVLKESNVTRWTRVEDIFLLADIYAERGMFEKAIRLYDEGLSVNSWRYEYQLKLMDLLFQTGEEQEAVERAINVYEFIDAPIIRREIEAMFSRFGLSLPIVLQESKVKFVDNVAIMIVPFDRIDKSFLNDFGEKLHEIIGIKYIVSSENIAMGSPDRQIEQQYDARRLRDVLKEKFNIQQSSPIVGYLGITDKDIFTKNYNFLFGWAGQGYGVVSCFQFKEGVVIPSNDKFLNTVVKQGVSSSLHILGVKRNPADLLSSSACLSRYI